MLTPVTRRVLRVSAALYLALGVVLFLAPGWAAENFAWNVSPFLAMTIGGWCLGTAVIASETARIGRIAVVLPMLVYLGAFAILELAVLIAFAGAFRGSATLTVPYVAMLIVGAVSAVAGGIDWVRQPTSRVDPDDVPLSRSVIGVDIAFVLFVAALWIGGSIARDGGAATDGRIFGEPLSLFSVRAFAAFYFALDVAILSLVWRGRMRAQYAISRAGLLLIVPITGAALLNIGVFDFGARPAGIIYFAAYIVTGVLVAIILTRDRAWRSEASG